MPLVPFGTVVQAPEVVVAVIVIVAAVVRAAQRAVRRWRVTRIAAQLPGLMPTLCDVPDAIHFRSVLVDCGQFLSLWLHAKGPGAKISKFWSPEWRSSLCSAVVGGQWTQARRAAVPDWGIEDARCQLCRGEVGTLEHRFRCPATLPEGGWPAPGPKAGNILEHLSLDRRKWLQTRGLLLLRAPLERGQAEGCFTWHKPVPVDDPALEEAIWHF